MKEVNIKVENIKCGGCANHIIQHIQKLDGIEGVSVDIENELVLFHSENEESKFIAIDKLSKMGYPLEGESNLSAKAKSYVSCMLGRMSLMSQD